MDHCCVVGAIIKHAVTGNTAATQDYITLLVEKLRADGEERQARIIESAASGQPPDPRETIAPPKVPPETAVLFPALPRYRGSWCPVYWTPISGSGERLTAFVIALGDDGQICIRHTIRDDALQSMCGEKAVGVRNFLAVIEQALNAQHKAGATLEDWVLPLSGFVLGRVRQSYAENVRQLAAQGIQMEASFADPAAANLNQE